MTNDEKADYIAKRLVEVKKILDEIAENTGEVMVVFGESVAMIFAALGQNFTNFILKTQDLLADRLVLANKFRAKEMDKYENETPDDVVREMKNFCAPNMEAAENAWAEFGRRYQAAMERAQNRKETK